MNYQVIQRLRDLRNEAELLYQFADLKETVFINSEQAADWSKDLGTICALLMKHLMKFSSVNNAAQFPDKLIRMPNESNSNKVGE